MTIYPELNFPFLNLYLTYNLANPKKYRSGFPPSTIRKHKDFIKKELCNSLSLFSIYLETLLIRLAELMPIEDILAYTDIYICVYDLKVLENVIKYIKE